jgi:signal transduction histidine kinase/DNA-binding response OmpR family regulator/sugar lactone lactonase YvrE
MKNMRFLSAFVFFVFLFFEAKGQTDYVFHHLSTVDGLSNSHVYTILRDRSGFLWIGTEAGLNRYDGYRFKIYPIREANSNVLSYSDIVGLSEDVKGDIWVDIGHGYVVYSKLKDQFITDIPGLLKKYSITVERNYKIYIDINHNLWVFSDGRIYYYNYKNNIVKIIKNTLPVSDYSNIGISDNEESLCVITKEGALFQIGKFSGRLARIDLPDFVRNDMSGNYNKIYADTNFGLWLFSNKSNLIYYKRNSASLWKKIALNSTIKTQTNVVQSIMDDGAGNVWIGTDHKGVFVYDKNKDAVRNIKNDPYLYTSIASNNVDCIYRDNNGTIWLGHDKLGISYFHESFQNIVNIQSPGCRDVSVIFEDKKGYIWYGTDGNGIFVQNGGVNNPMQKISFPNFAIVSLQEDKKGRMWIGTYQNGLFCYDHGTIIQYTTANSNLSDNNIWSLHEDRYGNLWIGALGGKVQCFQPDTRKFCPEKVGLEVKYPQSIYYDGGNNLYVGTAYGLYIKNVLSGKKVSYFGNAHGTQKFKQPYISTIFKDKKGRLWLGHLQGITIWDLKKDTLYYLDKETGLCDDIIRGIVEDGYGNVVVTTSNGMSIISVSNNKAEDLTFACRNFSVKDGLKSNSFNNHSLCKLRNGNILLGDADGSTLICSNKMAEKKRPLANVVFTELKVANQVIEVDSLYHGHKFLDCSLEKTSELTFRYDDQLIAFYFTTGDLLHADKVKYAYKLEGFTNQWLFTKEDKIEFSALPPGSYRLLIKACNSDGVWNEDPVVLDIRVLPPFYLSWGAIVMYIILLISLFLYIIKRTKRHHRIKLEQQKLQIEHEQAMNLNEMKLKFFTNISHDLRTPLTLIITPIQIMLNEVSDEKLRKTLQTMHKNAEQLLHLINSLLDFRKLDVGAETLKLRSEDLVSFIRGVYSSFQMYATDRKINFILTTDVDTLPMRFDPDKVQKIVINLLSNAFKYTPDGGAVTVSIARQDNNACIRISDTGSGISDSEKRHVFERFYQAPQKQDKTGSGIGLHIVSEYVQMHGGVVEVTDNVPAGSVFSFTIPIVEPDMPVFDESETIEKEEDVPDSPERPTANKKPVLLFVDDNKDFCDFMSDSLSDEYEVLTAYNGQEAIDQLNQFDVNIVVSDVMMPVMSGTELCKQIKTNILWSHIPVILLTARTAEEAQVEGLELGADDYITKPFNFNILKLRVRRFIEWTEKCHVAFSQKMDVSPSEITITSLDQQLIEKAIRVVEENISDTEFSVEALGSAVGMSRSHLYKKLMNITGKGPAEFIRTVRLKRGRQLLEKSQLQIAEIAYAVGFNSPKIFTKNFRIEFGVSPSEYLRSLNKPTQEE